MSFIALFAVVVGGVTFPTNEIYVAANGSDSATGTIRSPWQTLAKVNATTTTGKTVFLRGGDTFQPPFTAQSSTAYKAYGTGSPVISGGQAVTTWTLFDAGKNIWKATFSASTSRPRNLWCNGVRVIRPELVVPTGLTSTSTGMDSAASSSPGFLSGYAQPDKVEFIFRMLWEEQRVPVTAVSGNSITIQTEAWNRMKSLYTRIAILTLAQSAWKVTNAYEILASVDAAGTFFHDETAGFLYMVPPAGVSDPNSASVIAPVLNTLTTFSGVSSTSFDGITFSYANTNFPTDNGGYVEVQSTTVQPSTTTLPTTDPVLDVLPANLEISSSSSISFTRCTFTHLGASAVHVGAGCTAVSFIGCSFVDVSASALIDSFPDCQTKPKTFQTVFSNNLINTVGVEFRGASAATHFFGDDFTAEHNHIVNVPYSGFSNGLGWSSTNASLRNTGARIRYNKINSAMLQMKDGGAIYDNAGQVDAIVSFNLAYTIGNAISTPYIGLLGTNAIYLDNGSSGHTASGNVSYLIGGDFSDYQLNDNQDGGNTGSSNSTDSGLVYNTGTPPITPNTVTLTIVGLTAAQIAGRATGAGLEPAYNYLDTLFP